MADFFIRRPIVAIVISIVTVLVGLLTMQSLPIAQYPEITPPMVQVTTTYTGASAVNVEQAVATPVEQKVNGVEKMLYMKSYNSGDGTFKLEVSFDVDSDLDFDNMLTLNRANQATPLLPVEVKNYGVTVKKALSFPMMIISLHSPGGTYQNYFLSNYATINIIDAIARIDGVGDVKLLGGSDYAMRFWVKPDIVSKLGITIPDIIKAIKEQNLISPGGKFGGSPAVEGTEYTYTVLLKDRLITEQEFGNILIRTNENGGEVKLKDVARIELGTETYYSEGRLNGKPGALVAIYQLPGSNALKVAEEISNKMTELKEKFPADVEYVVSLDTTLAVEEGISEIITTLFEAIFLVILVVFIFLQNWRATLIPLLTVPVSLVGCFIIFPMLGFTINTLSMLGLVLAIGIVVDDAIVVVEAVMHHIERGLSPVEATKKAMKEVTGPVIAIALILTAVFVPVAMTGGITGRLYQQFAITIAISVLFSAFNALTLSPALSAMLLKPHKQMRGPLGKFFGLFNRIFDKITDKYVGLTGFFIKKLIRTVILLGGIVAVIVFLGKGIPSGFVPEEDQGYFLVNVILPDAASLERTSAICDKVEKILEKEKGIEMFNTVPGYSLLASSYIPNNGFFFVTLKPWEDRKAKEEHYKAIIARINAEFIRVIPEATVIAVGPPAILGLGNASGYSFMLQDRGGNSPDYLQKETAKFINAAVQRPEIATSFSVYRANVPQYRIDLDLNKAKKIGLSIDEVNQTLAAYLGSSYVNDFNRFGRQYKTYIQAEAEYRVSPQSLSSFYVRNNEGAMVPVSTVAEIIPVSGPDMTNRFNMYRAAEIMGSPAPGYSSDDALNALEEVAKEVLPKDMGFAWSNMSYQEKEGAGQGATVFLYAMIFVFLILAAQYESWSLPFSVLLGTPFAVFGAFLGLWLARFVSESYVNNVFAQIGLVMLIGLAAKNAILIVEFAKMKVEEGKSIIEAATEAAKLRFRPILMTAFAFILGVVPLVRAAGAGAESRKVMGMTVFSGMLIATILGVVLVPSLFVLIEKLGKKKKHMQADETIAGEGH